MSSYFLKLDQFEGPLDLLLHLIKAHELDIFEIDLFVLTTQYLDYLRLSKFRHLKEAAAFIEMAASLIEIKSKSLLPREKSDAELIDGESDDEDITDEAKLRQRLLQYEMVKNAAKYLDQLASSQRSYPNQLWRLWEDKTADIEAPIKGDRHTLLILYEQMLASLVERRPVRVTALRDSVLIDKIIEKLAAMVERIEVLLFSKLYSKIESRYELVVYILALLQLTADKKLCLHQEEAFGPLWLYSKGFRARYEGESESFLYSHIIEADRNLSIEL